uniref:TIL domain-containing protein n=1 Tax=Syphacia muris TaxID=451379 RepID=A0A158R466_9BILA
MTEYFQLLVILHAATIADASCIGIGCPLGQICNIDTGECTVVTSALNVDFCNNVTCPAGSRCDPTTGRCESLMLQLAPPLSYKTAAGKNLELVQYIRNNNMAEADGIQISCNYISCPYGYECNRLTGRCVIASYFRNADADLCLHVSCPRGYQCNTASGVCTRKQNTAKYRQSNMNNDRCFGVKCPYGTVCDSRNGGCISYRMSTSNNVMDLCYGIQCRIGECDPHTGRCLSTSLNRFTQQELRSKNLCTGVVCPFGVCDPETGRCAQYKWTRVQPPVVSQPASVPKSLCDGTQCPTGTYCDSNTGNCVSYKAGALSTPHGKQRSRKHLCADVKCPQGSSCDHNTGLCRQFRPIQSQTLFDLCTYVRCPNGYQCDSKTGVCSHGRPIRHMLSEPVSCPVHSHYVECGSPCPYTCNDVRRPCLNPCINTCQCDDTYVQVSLTNVTCVPAEQCKIYGRDLCTNLKCPDSMVCVDGYCNPVNCPHLIKPNLPKGCAYDLNRDERNCLVFDIIC